MLCADCDNATAARRAEQIRKALARLPQPKLDGRTITASFGVTEIQPGDTPGDDAPPRRPGLLMAKAKGRNTVVQLGSRHPDEDGATGVWFRKAVRADLILEQDLVTPVPARWPWRSCAALWPTTRPRITAVEGSNVHLQIGEPPVAGRRQNDRRVTFLIDLKLEEEAGKKSATTGAIAPVRTRVHVTVSPLRSRDRRRAG